jgi:hypothetical protein
MGVPGEVESIYCYRALKRLGREGLSWTNALVKTSPHNATFA